MEPVNNGRAIVEIHGRDVKIVIPARRQFFVIAFLSMWLMGWAFGELTVLGMLIAVPRIASLFILVWLLLWTLGGASAIYTLLWQLFGKETIYSEGAALVVGRDVLFFKRRKRYDIRHIKHIHIASIYEGRGGNTFRGRSRNVFWRGRIAFDYGMKTIYMAIGIDDAEAKYLIEDVLSRFLTNN